MRIKIEPSDFDSNSKIYIVKVKKSWLSKWKKVDAFNDFRTAVDFVNTCYPGEEVRFYFRR